MAAIGGGVGAGLGGSAAVGKLLGKTGVFQSAIRGAASSAITQGIGVVTGLQDKFSWAGVAGAAVGADIGASVGDVFGSSFGGRLATSAASAIANAATRSAIDGTNFGDNIIAAIPDVIGGAIGNAVAGEIGDAVTLARANPLKNIKAFEGLRDRDLINAQHIIDGLDAGQREAMRQGEVLRDSEGRPIQSWSEAIANGSNDHIDALKQAVYLRADQPPPDLSHLETIAEKGRYVSQRLVELTAGVQALQEYSEALQATGVVEEVHKLAITNPLPGLAVRGGDEKAQLGNVVASLVDGLVAIGKFNEKISSSRFARRCHPHRL